MSFRAYAQREARRLGVAGWVANRGDGAVEARVEGDDDAVEAMTRWCRTGSPAARVAGVSVSEAEVSGVTSFEVRR
ncbi:acylphosphatase [Nocardioides marinquilinus]|uniref:acylphosphatase n=1 Tax=Nocardioides marinquilinus TaxID=1210400 RepID=UPI0031E5ABA0